MSIFAEVIGMTLIVTGAFIAHDAIGLIVLGVICLGYSIDERLN